MSPRLPPSTWSGTSRSAPPPPLLPPPPKPPSSGFPAHRKRTGPSAFKQRRTDASPQPSHRPSLDEEKRSIDEENRRRIASMSPAQIQREREELMSGLSPSLIERLLRRANIDDPQQTTEPPARTSSASDTELPAAEPSQPPSTSTGKTAPPATAIDDLPPPRPPEDLRPASEVPPPPIHFPAPPPRQDPMPNLDPSSPSFLADLQSHYFPDTPHDPSALSWLQPPSADPEDPDASRSAYHPASSATAVAPAALRFSLTGTLLAPSTSLSLPPTLGLHHHAADPHAAGYTIPELAILSRSTFPAQRCIAWQVIGRILFRLGKGEFGERGSTLVEGLWDVIEREGVVAGMLAEADGGVERAERAADDGDKDREEARTRPAGTPAAHKGGIGRHASARAWALEGVWLWRMGGGGDRGLSQEGVVRSQ
ncbi:hypothetical protein VTN00DRAFT_7386 [Thermoascus crustaceus]|uniref:uncharacterized protein n=1 Tax=Thermoascus crustaceus TaxID=5088 RepID=UPI0037431774